MKEWQQRVKDNVRLERAQIFNVASPLTNFEIWKYYRNEHKFNGAYSRNNLPKTKDGAYVINLEEFKLIGFTSLTHWIALYVNAEDVTYFDSFGVSNIPE